VPADVALSVILLVCNGRGAKRYKNNDRLAILSDVSFTLWTDKEMSIRSSLELNQFRGVTHVPHLSMLRPPRSFLPPRDMM
jgi:hypothetical protein